MRVYYKDLATPQSNRVHDFFTVSYSRNLTKIVRHAYDAKHRSNLSCKGENILYMFKIFNDGFTTMLKNRTVLLRLSHDFSGFFIFVAYLSYDRVVWKWLNTSRPRQDGRLFADDIFKRIFFNENVNKLIQISLKFVPRCSFNDTSALVSKMAWRRLGDKPLSKPMMTKFIDAYMRHSASMS